MRVVKEAVDSATAEMTARLSTLEASTKQTETTTAVEAAVAPLKSELADLQTKLETAAAEAKTEREARETIEKFLATEQERLDREAEIASLVEERAKAVAETNAFDAEFVKANAPKWAALTAEDFGDRLEEFKAFGARNGGKPVVTPAGEIPKKTSMTAAAAGDGAEKPSAVVASVVRTQLESSRGWTNSAK